jgi:hypothetical protein
MAMHSPLLAGGFIGSLLLPGCMGGAGSSSVDSMSVGSWVTANFIPPSAQRRVKGSARDLFVADVDSNVLVYSAGIKESKPPLLEEITQGVSRSTGVCVDRHGTLYVLNFGGSATNVSEYRRGQMDPFKTISKGLGYPSDLVVDGGGNLYVDESSGSGFLVAVYAKGAASPKRMIQLPANGRFVPAGMAFDPKGDLLVDTFDVESNAAIVYGIAPGSSQANDLDLQTPPGPSLGADKAGNIYIGNSAGYIAIYSSGSTSPSRAVDLNEDGFYTQMAVTPNGTIYWPNYDEGRMYEIAPGASGASNVFSTAGSGIAAAVGPW